MDNITVYDVRKMEQDIAYGIHVEPHKYSMIQILKGNHYSLNFVNRTQHFHLVRNKVYKTI